VARSQTARPPTLLRKTIRRHGIDYHWLARQTGYSVSYLQAVACGVKRPGLLCRMLVAEALGRPESELFDDVNNNGDAP
jgi:lambda repressor-like predicted transcriptional regulator